MRSVNAMSSEKICGKSRTCVVELNRGGNEALRRVSPPPSRLCFLSIWRFSFETSKPQKIKKLGGTNTYIAKWRDVLGCTTQYILSLNAFDLLTFWYFDQEIAQDPRDFPQARRPRGGCTTTQYISTQGSVRLFFHHPRRPDQTKIPKVPTFKNGTMDYTTKRPGRRIWYFSPTPVWVE